MAHKRRTSKMPKRNRFDKNAQIAGAYLLSFPQLFTWAIIFAFVGGLSVWTGLAASHRIGGDSLSLVMVTDNNSDGLPNYLDSVTFKVTTSVTNVWVGMECSQNGTVVDSETNG